MSFCRMGNVVEDRSDKSNISHDSFHSAKDDDSTLSEVDEDELASEVNTRPGTSSQPEAGHDTSLVLEREILMLIACSKENRIALEDLPEVYRNVYRRELPHGIFDQNESDEVMKNSPTLTVLTLPSGITYCIRRADMAMFKQKIKEQTNIVNQSEMANEAQSMVEDPNSAAVLLPEESPTNPGSVSVSPPPPPAPVQQGIASRSSEHVEQLILDLVDESSESQVMLSKLPHLYFSTFKSKIPFQEYGYNKLKPFLETLPQLSVRGSLGYCYVTKNVDQIDSDPPLAAKAELSVTQSSVSQDASSRELVSVPGTSVLLQKEREASFDLKPENGREDFLVPEDQKMSKVVIKEAASNLSPRLHGRLLSELAEHPEGITASQLMKRVKGLFQYLQACAKEVGQEFMSPVVFLSHCEGVCTRNVAGQKRIILDNNVPLEESPGYEGDNPIDVAADAANVIQLVKILQKNYQNRQWPATKHELKSFIASMNLQASPLEKGLEESLPNSSKQREKDFIKRAMHYLKKVGCINGSNKHLIWDLEKVQAIIEMENTTVPPEGQPNETKSNFSDDIPVTIIDTIEELESVVAKFPFNPLAKPASPEECVVAIDCEGAPESLFLIEVGTYSATYVFDCVKIGTKEVCESLRSLFTGSRITKLFHDIHNDAVAISSVGGVFPLSHTLDTQLAMESVTGNWHTDFNTMLQQIGQNFHPVTQNLKQKIDGGLMFAHRPIPADILKYAVLDVSLLLKAKGDVFAVVGSNLDSIQRASDRRANMAAHSGGARQICFDVANSCTMASLELLQELRPKDMLEPAQLEVSDDSGVVLEILPDDLCEILIKQTQQLSDIVLDKGRKPFAWINGTRVHLGRENRTINKNDIEGIVERIGGFDGDNRAGLERQLNRISAMRNRQKEIIGLTLRVGRHVSGNATMISDLMFAYCHYSILFLGEPGSGKTTVMRDVTKQLAERCNVCVVDTRNEIAGDGDIPHHCIGHARRMMVPSLEQQSSVMIECLQNHTPEVMVIDEIGRPSDVEAARTCKQRGVRLVASSHGDLRMLIKNPRLRGLLGDIDTVSFGDAQVKEEGKKSGGIQAGLQKLKPQRVGPPTFDIIVELRRSAQHDWRIVMDVGEAVDRVLEGQSYRAQRRTRDPKTGALTLEIEMA